MTFREAISVGDHDGHHPFPCDACQVIDLAVKEHESLIPEAWSVKSGETVLLVLDSHDPAVFAHARETLDHATAETGVHFVLMTPSVHVVNPKTGVSA